MLQNIREKLQGWLAFAMLLFIAVPLALTFVGPDFTVSGSGYAARVNGEEIPTVDFQRVYQDRLVAEQQAVRGELPRQAEDRLKRETLDGLVLNRAVTQYVNGAGYRVSSSRVIDYIKSQAVFQVGGQFSKPAYDATLASQQISPAAYEKEQQTMLAVSQLQEGLVESSFFTPTEFRRLIALDQERRDVAYVAFDPRLLGETIDISDADVQSYYSANADQFQSPESVNLEYVEVVASDMARDYAPDDETLRNAYASDPARFRTAEERRARHILIAVDATRTDAAARALADELAGKLARGEDFAALATKYSTDAGSASRGGDLGFSPPGNYVEPFERALFALQQGQTSVPVKTQFGYHIIRLDDVRPGSERPFDEVRSQLADELRQKKAQDEFYALAERLDDLALENPTSLEAVARETGLAVRRVDGFTRAGGGQFGNNASLVRAVFAPAVLDGSENTPVIELDDTHAIVARVAEHKTPTPRPLEAVRVEIIGRLRTLKGTTEALRRGEEIVKRVQAGEDFSAVVNATGARLTETGPVSRRSPVVPPELLAAVFSAPKPSGRPIVRAAKLSGGGYAVFQLRSAVPGVPESIPQEQRDQRKQALAQRVAVGEAEALAAQLRESAKVVVAPDLFKADETEVP